MAYDFLPTSMGGMPSCLTPRRRLVVSLCPLARRTPSPRIPHLLVSLTLSPSPSSHPLPISFTPSPSPLSVSFTLAPLPITLTLALSPFSLSSSHCHLSPSLSPSASLSCLVCNGLARSHSPSPLPQERVSLPLNLPLTSPAPFSYLREGVFFSAPSHSADPSPQALRPRPRPCLHGCAGKSGMCYSASFLINSDLDALSGPRRATLDALSTCTLGRHLNAHLRGVDPRARLRFEGSMHGQVIFSIRYSTSLTVPSRSHAYLDHPPRHPTHLLDIPLASSTSRSLPRHPAHALDTPTHDVYFYTTCVWRHTLGAL